MAEARRRELVADALASVGLTDVAGAYPWQLSGGMRQRVAIARAPAHEPEVLLMDEPFAAVDARTRADLEDLVRRLWRERGVTILFVTHDIDEAVRPGERVVVLSASPTVVRELLAVDLPAERDQVRTRAAPLHRAAHPRVRADPGGEARGCGQSAAGTTLRWAPSVRVRRRGDGARRASRRTSVSRR